MADNSKHMEKPDRREPEPGDGASSKGGRLAYRRDWKRIGRLLPPVLASWAAVVAGSYYVAMLPPPSQLPGPIAAAIAPLESNPFRGCRAGEGRTGGGDYPDSLSPDGSSPSLPNEPGLPNELNAPVPNAPAPNAPAKASGLFVRSAQAQAPLFDEMQQQIDKQQLLEQQLRNEENRQLIEQLQRENEALKQQVPQPVEQQPQPQQPAQQTIEQRPQPQQPAQQPVEQQPQPQVQEPVGRQQQQTVQSGMGSGDLSPIASVPAATDCEALGFGDLIDVAMDKNGQSAWVINRYGLVYHSNDGGKTWSQQYLPDLPDSALLSAIAVDDEGRRLVAAVRGDLGLLFYRSDDGGVIWRSAPEMDPYGGLPTADWAGEVAGLGIGAVGGDGQDGGDVYVLALPVLMSGEAIPMVWRDRASSWAYGYEHVEPEMANGQRAHDFGTGIIDISANGLFKLPIGTWERWQSADEVRFTQYNLDEKDPTGALTDKSAPITAYEIGARTLRALAASDDGLELFGAQDTAILHGNARNEPWLRTDLIPAAGGADFALQAIDVANGDRSVMAVGNNALFVSHNGGATFFQPALARWPAPWFYLVLLSGPFYAFLLMRPGPPEQQIIDADETKGLSDRALGLKDPDALNLQVFAKGLAGLLLNEDSKPPLVVGVTGPWGSGKSSVMLMLSELLARDRMQTVWFNAWHHQSEEHLLASLLSNIRRQGIPGFWTKPGLRLRWRLILQKLTPHMPLGGFLWSWFLLLAGAALLSGALAFWLMPPVNVPAAVEAARASDTEVSERIDRTEKTTVTDGVETVERMEKIEKNERRVGGATPRDAGGEVGQAVAATQDFFCDAADKNCNQLIESAANLLVSLKLGALITLLLGLVPLSQLKQVALISRSFDPGKLMTSVMPAKRNPNLDEQLSFRHGFGEELRATVAALAPYRLVIFIDDLDRCRPENVAKILEAVNFVVSAADCYVVLGMDRAYVLRAIRQEFDKFIEMEKAERQELGASLPEEDKGRPRDFADHYLEKLVNLIISVPKMTAEARARLMDSLASALSAAEGDRVPAFDWWRWARRGAAAATIAAALLGPAVYFVMQAPPPNLPGATGPISPPAQIVPVPPADTATPSGEVRLVRPDIRGASAVEQPQGPAHGGIGPLLLVLCGIAAIAGILWAVVHGVSVPANLLVRDSGIFKTTLQSVQQRLARMLTTPRRAKRFVNRLRLFAAMTRSEQAPTPAEEAKADRFTVEAGTLHALARELLLLAPILDDPTPPKAPGEHRAWEETREQAAESQKVYRDELVSLYRAAGRDDRSVIDSLYWRFWELSDGATTGDPAIIRIAEEAVRAAGGSPEEARATLCAPKAQRPSLAPVLQPAAK